MKDRMIYVSVKHTNAKVLRSITCSLSRDNPNVCVLNPKIAFSHFRTEDYMENSLALLDMCDEMWVVGEIWNAEKYEIEFCRKYKIPVKAVRG